MRHSANFMLHPQEQPCSRRILRTLAFCGADNPPRSTPGNEEAVFQSSAYDWGATRTERPITSPACRRKDFIAPIVCKRGPQLEKREMTQRPAAWSYAKETDASSSRGLGRPAQETMRSRSIVVG